MNLVRLNTFHVNLDTVARGLGYLGKQRDDKYQQMMDDWDVLGLEPQTDTPVQPGVH